MLSLPSDYHLPGQYRQIPSRSADGGLGTENRRDTELHRRRAHHRPLASGTSYPAGWFGNALLEDPSDSVQ